MYIENGMISIENAAGIPDGNYLTTDEFAKRHNIRPGTVRQWILRKHVASVKYGGNRYIPEDQEPYRFRYKAYKK